jgi:hypothetical protein
LVLVVSVQCQWLNNFGYGLNPAGYFGGYYPANGIHTGYTGFPSAVSPFYGHPGRFVNYPAASLPSYDAFGNQIGGYGQVQDTPEVAQAKAAHFAAHAAATAHLMAPVAVPVAAPVNPVVETIAAAPVESVAVAATPVSRKKRQIQPLAPVNSSPLAFNFGGYYPANNVYPTAYTGGIAPVFPLATSTQYHAQDEFGQTTFGYSHPGQASTNYRDAFGNQIGSYSYFNPEGKQVRVSYTADHRGFRVLSNDLPVAPLQVQDTLEVAQAKAAHFAAHAAVRARLTPVTTAAVEVPAAAVAAPAEPVVTASITQSASPITVAA